MRAEEDGVEDEETRGSAMGFSMSETRPASCPAAARSVAHGLLNAPSSYSVETHIIELFIGIYMLAQK